MIRELNIDEMEKIIEIERESFNNPWDLESYEKMTKDFKTHVFAWFEEEEVIAYGVLLDMIDVYELVKIAVKKTSREKGFGNKLLAGIIEKLSKNIFLEVRITNEKAIKLYEKNGFKKINVRKNYYKDTGEDAVIMSVEIK